MTELLDIVDSSLQEVEEQLLQEFDRIRNSLSDSRYEPIDSGVKNALTEVINDLTARLDHSGDRQNLSLMTERHEILLARIVVVRQLLNSKVPTAFLHEAHSEVVSNRKTLESKVQAKRQSEEPEQQAEHQKLGFMSKLKGFFGSENKTEKEVSRNRIRVTEQEIETLEPVSIYLDNGIYSASRELAALANVFSLPKDTQEEIQQAHAKRVEGKALFESRDLSSQQTPPVKIGAEIAQSPDEIRRKLAERQGVASGKASFGSKDIAHVQAKQTPPKPPSQMDIASARRADVEAEKANRPTTGKATFVSKDIEPAQPQEFRKRPSRDADKKEPEKPRSGKAVFESRDLSGPSPTQKK